MPTPSIFPYFMKAVQAGAINVFGEVQIEVAAMPDVELQPAVDVEVAQPQPVEVDVAPPVDVEVPS